MIKSDKLNLKNQSQELIDSFNKFISIQEKILKLSYDEEMELSFIRKSHHRIIKFSQFSEFLKSISDKKFSIESDYPFGGNHIRFESKLSDEERLKINHFLINNWIDSINFLCRLGQSSSEYERYFKGKISYIRENKIQSIIYIDIINDLKKKEERKERDKKLIEMNFPEFIS